jgi:tRNA (guanine-N7-)-methyltransferase
MNRFQWNIRRTVKGFVKNVTGYINYVKFPLTIESLKSAVYNELPVPFNLQKIAQTREIHVEIGSGHGEVLLSNNPERSIMVGYEIRTRFFRLTQRKIAKRSDIFVYQGNGYESTLLHYANSSISRLLILFPDPWHKKKHNKRRPITAEYFRKVVKKLKNGAQIIVATDWMDYAEFIEKEVALVADIYQVEMKKYDPVEFGLPITHFHQKWIRKGRSFNVFVLTKQ